MNLKLALQLCNNMGSRYVLYRCTHELKKKSGVLKLKHPQANSEKTFITLDQWRTQSGQAYKDIKLPKQQLKLLSDSVQRILSNEIKFFNADWVDLGTNYDWVTNPITGFQFNRDKHWSEIKDFDSSQGDIKDVWEKSRFSYLLTIMRYDYHFDEDHSEFVFQEIESWINHNPINSGPNWKCSQEISLRLFNWSFLLNFYKNSKYLSEKLWNKIQTTIYWSIHHIYHHINFSRIAVRNNHAITETLLLTLSKYLFSFIPETQNWSEKGRVYFEQEIDYQIYEDGTFLQFSMNYHRVVIQLLTLGISVTETYNQPFSKTVYVKAYKSLNFLYQCLQEESGYLPNYGANDGALFFPLSDTDYRDFRPQLNALHKLLTGENIFHDSLFCEDLFWFNPKYYLISKYPVLKKTDGGLSFSVGGYYLFRWKGLFTFIRCGNHKDRPSQADNLHIDVWYKGKNVLGDSGSYKYNTDKETLNYFVGTKGHNTVLLDNKPQMLKGGRFIWYYWSQVKNVYWEETEKEYFFEGIISVYRYIDKGIIHKRKLLVDKTTGELKISDFIEGAEDIDMMQLWHGDVLNLEISARDKSMERIDQKEIPSYKSVYYGKKIKQKGVGYFFKERIETKIKILK